MKAFHMDKNEKKRKEAHKEYLKRPAHFAEVFIEKYGADIEGLPQVEILKVFFVYSNCANQFAVVDYINKLKRKYKK